MQTVTLPPGKTAEKAGALPESFGLTWQRAVKAGAAVVPQAKSDVGERKMAKSAKSDSAAEEKPEEVLNQDEKAEADVRSDEQVSVTAQLSAKTLVAAQGKKPGSLSAEVETKKKAADVVDVAAAADKSVEAEVEGTATNLMIVATPLMIVAAVAPKAESKVVAKTDAVPVKKERVAGGDSSKPAAAETKPETDEAKALPVADVKAKVIDTAAAPVAVTHASVGGSSAAEANGSGTQGMIASVAPELTHKGAGQISASAELQSAPVAADGGEVNAVHALAAGPGQLEVGVLDGTHGWLKIRAEMGPDGSVNAMLTASATAHEGLKESVPELAGYLVSESLNVGRIAVHQAAASSAAGGDLSNAGGGSARQDGGADSPYPSLFQGSARGVNGPANETTQQDVDSAMSGIAAAVFSAGPRFSANGIGSWLSVTA